MPDCRSRERIAQIVVSPKNSDTVFASVPGALWSDSPDRGLYRTTDGGKNWELALKGSNLSTGCSDVAIDPHDSNVMFAALWDFQRKGWTFRSGGDGPNAPSGSGLFRSSDGGNTWNEITAENSKQRRTARVFQKNHLAVLPLRSHHRIRSGFTLLLNPPIARSSSPTMAAATGTSAIRVSGWSGGPFTSPI